jgi:hypothetical protein
MSVYKKLQEARILLQNTKLNKSGKNKFAGYEYFELGDFLPQIQNICKNVGLCGMVSFTADTAYLTIHDTDGEGFTTFTSPMSSAALKGCHDVQNLGAVQTYLRRYLWTNAFEIVEHDAIDAAKPIEQEEVEMTESQLGKFKTQLEEALKEGKLKEAFFKLPENAKTQLRDYANELKKSA